MDGEGQTWSSRFPAPPLRELLRFYAGFLCQGHFSRLLPLVIIPSGSLSLYAQAAHMPVFIIFLFLPPANMLSLGFGYMPDSLWEGVKPSQPSRMNPLRRTERKGPDPRGLFVIHAAQQRRRRGTLRSPACMQRRAGRRNKPSLCLTGER